MSAIQPLHTTNTMSPSPASPGISVVLPCLNESRTIARVIEEIQAAFMASDFSFEVIVADNGSTDGSDRIAQSHGARVIPVATRGYGAALRAGIDSAHGTTILFGDADLTYNFGEGPALVRLLLDKRAAMSMGTRFRGTIERGAMPPLHRYLGTPVLTRLINLLFGSRITDCNSGFRAFRKADYAHWHVGSDGMEFASELIIGCLKSGGRIVEMPITLRRDTQDRTPHLSAWRDGMRHLLFIVSRAPHGFAYAGVLFGLASLTLALPSIFLGPTHIGPFWLFDIHTLILAIFTGFIAVQSFSYGLILDSGSRTPLPINKEFLEIKEVALLRVLVGLFVLFGLFVAFIAGVWMKHGFNNLHYFRLSLSVLYAIVTLGGLGYGILIAQVHRRL